MVAIFNNNHSPKIAFSKFNMRDELKCFETYFRGLSKDDIIYTSNLAKSFFRAYMATLSLPPKVNTPEIDLYMESHIREAKFCFQFGIWRLQSVFESLLKKTFEIETRKGLNDILTILKKKKYHIIEESKLKNWSELRNILTHSAPERFNPVPSNIFESVIEEYSALLFRIYENLERQLEKEVK